MGRILLNMIKTGSPNFAKKVAMVFQQFGLFTHRTVLGNIEYGLEIKRG